MIRRTSKAWLYLLPALLFLGFFMVYPLFDVFVYSVEEGYNSASQTYFGTGLYNYSYVLHDPYFLQAVKNTFIIVIITVPLSTAFALAISLALSSVKKLKELYQTVFFLPYVTNTLAVGLVFMILFKKTAYTDGMVNLLIQLFGGKSVDFIDGPYWAKMFVMCFYTILLRRRPGRRHAQMAHLHQNYPAHDLAHDLLPDHHRLYRGIQGLQR